MSPVEFMRVRGDQRALPQQKMPWRGLGEAEVTQDMCFGFSTVQWRGALPVLAPLGEPISEYGEGPVQEQLAWVLTTPALWHYAPSEGLG